MTMRPVVNTYQGINLAAVEVIDHGREELDILLGELRHEWIGVCW